MMPKIEVDYRPYPFQEEVHKSRARFRILVAGRRSGKTYLAIAECLMRALKRPNRRIGWFAPKGRIPIGLRPAHPFANRETKRNETLAQRRPHSVAFGFRRVLGPGLHLRLVRKGERGQRALTRLQV